MQQANWEQMNIVASLARYKNKSNNFDCTM